VETAKPPVPVEVVDLQNFARLALGLVEEPPLIWHFKFEERHVLGVFAAYMYWTGDLPLFAYITIDEKPGSFLAYRSNAPKGEEFVFTNEIEDPKFVYSPLIDLAKPPQLLEKCLREQAPTPPKPMLSEITALHSLVRVLLLLSLRETAVFPIWHFKRDKMHIIGTCVPFEHYYESDALPVFFYLKQDHPPASSFIRYCATKFTGEKLEYVSNTADTKYFHAKIVDVKNLPIFP